MTEGRSYMKIMRTTLVTLAVGLGLLALTASQAQATGTGKFTCALKAYQQGLASTNGNIVKWTIENAKVTTKDILAFIQEYSEPPVAIPDGSYIEVDWDGDLTVFNKDGVEIVVANLSSLMYVEYGDDGVWSGKYNDETYQEKSKGSFMVYFGIIAGDGDRVDTSGLGKESYSLGDTTQDTFKETTSIHAPVAGDGDVEGDFTTVSGYVSIKGKETITP